MLPPSSREPTGVFNGSRRSDHRGCLFAESRTEACYSSIRQLWLRACGYECRGLCPRHQPHQREEWQSSLHSNAADEGCHQSLHGCHREASCFMFDVDFPSALWLLRRRHGRRCQSPDGHCCRHRGDASQAPPVPVVTECYAWFRWNLTLSILVYLMSNLLTSLPRSLSGWYGFF